MADDDGGGLERPLITGSIDPRRKTSKRVDLNDKRRLRRSSSAPSTAHTREEQLLVPSLPPLNSTFGKFDTKKILILLFLHLAAGTICFYLLRNQIKGKKTINGVLDSLYFCIVTMTSLGYGDRVHNTVVTKLLISLYIFSGMALVFLVLTKLANYLVEKQELFLLEALIRIQKFGPRESLVINNKSAVMKNNKSIIVLFMVLLVLLILVGTVFLVTVEGLDITDAFYCVCSTIGSIGYGDKSFSTTTGRTFAIFWISISILYLAYFLFTIVELNTQKRQQELVKWIINKRMTRNEDHLEEDDADLGRDFTIS